MTTPPIAFVDCETTGLDPARHEVWEIATIRRDPDGQQTEHLWQLRPSSWHLQCVADPQALEIGRYHERAAIPEPATAANMLHPDGPAPLDHLALCHAVWTALDGAVMVGSNPGFHTAFLARLLRGRWPMPWHYRPVDIATLAAGYLIGAGRGAETAVLYSSRALSRAVGVEPPGPDDAHTALADARWARDVYDAITTR